MTPEPVTGLASEQHILKAASTGRTYRITVSLPLGYHSQPGDVWLFKRLPERWPIVYVLDGNWYSGLVTEMIRPAAWCGGITDAIVVGIGYPEDESPAESVRTQFIRRDHDLTPTPDADDQQRMEALFNRPVPNGGAADFLAFIRDDLIPMIEREYRADPARRILVGHSYGGLFALYALFEAPGLFDTLIAGSPTLSFGGGWMVKREAEFAGSKKELLGAVYLFASEEEEDGEDTTLTDTLRLAAVMAGREYGGLRLFKKLFEGQNHCEVAAPGFHWGLKEALKRER